MLTWKWDEKVGYLVSDFPRKNNDTEVNVNLYGGNALMIAISEWKKNEDDMYCLYTFFADDKHAKNCLGLAKGKDYILDGIKEVHIYADMYQTNKRLFDLWAQAIAKWNLDVKLVLETNTERKECE